MKIQELRNLIRSEVRKAINESTKLVKEETNLFADEFATSRDAIKFFSTKMLPADQAFIGKPLIGMPKGEDEQIEIWSRPSGPKIATAVAEKLKQNKIDSLAMLYKVNKLKYTGTETLQDFLNKLPIKQSRSQTMVRIAPMIEVETLEIN